MRFDKTDGLVLGFVALLTTLLLMLVAKGLPAQEAPDCPVWSAEMEDGIHMVMELRPVSRVALGIEDLNDESLYLIVGGPGFGDVNDMVCLDVDTVDGNPKPGAQATVAFMGKVVCYRHQPDGTVVMENGAVLHPDPARTEEVMQKVCLPAMNQNKGVRS